jgi:hypothetical protein
MSISTEDYLRRLRAAIGCPEQWTLYAGDWEFRRVLLHYWAEVARGHQSFWEMDYYFQMPALLSKSTELIERIESNVPIWRPRAVAAYESKIAIFRKFHHLDEKQHDKHWHVTDRPREKLIEGTRSGPAKYFYRYPLLMLQRALYDGVRFNWRRIAEERIPHLYVTFRKEIGASMGKAARHVRFDINYADGGVHSRPIQPEVK